MKLPSVLGFLNIFQGKRRDNYAQRGPPDPGTGSSTGSRGFRGPEASLGGLPQEEVAIQTGHKTDVGEEEPWRKLLGSEEGGSGRSTVTAAKAVESRPAAAPVRPAVAGSSGPQQPSMAVMRAAARHGVPLPSLDTDEGPYGLLDEYVDDLLGIPLKDRPKDWKRPSINDSEAALKAAVPHIVYSDGRRGPPERAAPQRESRTAKSSPYLNGVLTGWASIDKDVVAPKVVDEHHEAVPSTVLAGSVTPAPKRRADR